MLRQHRMRWEVFVVVVVVAVCVLLMWTPLCVLLLYGLGHMRLGFRVLCVLLLAWMSPRMGKRGCDVAVVVVAGEGRGGDRTPSRDCARVDCLCLLMVLRVVGSLRGVH